MKYIAILSLTTFLVLYFYVFTGERIITHYSKGGCTLTRVLYKNWGDIWADLYYGKLDYDDIDENKCFIRCEIRGGFNGMMDGFLMFHRDSIILCPNEGAFYKCNCSDEKLILRIDPHYQYYSNNAIYFTYGFSENYPEYGAKAETLPAEHTLKFFNTVSERDACEYYDSSK